MSKFVAFATGCVTAYLVAFVLALIGGKFMNINGLEVYTMERPIPFPGGHYLIKTERTDKRRYRTVVSKHTGDTEEVIETQLWSSAMESFNGHTSMANVITNVVETLT